MAAMESRASEGIAFADPVPAATALAALPEPVARWFLQRYGRPTLAQCLAWPAVASGKNLLLSAPTGTGKTLAGFLPILARLFTEAADPPSAPARGVRCLYVAPLKALGRDAGCNLDATIRELIAVFDVPIAPRLSVRTGDTSARDRRRQRDDPPEILLTTPESLALLLSWPHAKNLFARLRHVVIDEIHALAPNKRGADLAVSMERLEALTSERLQRVGLSATAQPLEVAARFLVGEDRPCCIAATGEGSPLELEYRPLDGGAVFLRQLVATLAPAILTNRATLIFTNARGLAERLSRELRNALPEWAERIAVHHASLAADRRREVEASFKRGDLRAVVSSTSLELGIDVGRVDLVVLVHPPGDVVRLLQRVGRAGHGPGRVRRGLVLTASVTELLEAVVTGACGRLAECEPLRLADRPLDVLCQQVVGMSSAGACDADAVFDLVRRAAPFRDLARQDFDDCISYLVGRDREGQQWLPARLDGDSAGFTIRDGRTARLLRCNLGSILAEETTTVCLMQNAECRMQNAATARGTIGHAAIPIGEVDRPFAENLQPGDRFLLDGRCLEVCRLELGTVYVDEVPGRPGAPRWANGGWPLSSELAQRLYLLRVRAAEALRDGAASLVSLLRTEYGASGEAAAVLAGFFERQETLSEIPGDDCLLVEAVGGHAAFELYVHTPLNRPANDALARVAVHRLARDLGRAADSVVGDLGFALLVRGAVRSPIPELIRQLLAANALDADLDAALAASPTLRERFARVATTGLMLLRNPVGGKRKVGGRTWGERQLFDRVQAHDPDFVLMRQALHEVRTELCDGSTGRQFAEKLPRLNVKCRWLSAPSPFAEGWTQLESGPGADAESPTDALRRLHAALTGARESRASIA
jgi:ATP-dependent Lhr-like helicase